MTRSEQTVSKLLPELQMWTLKSSVPALTKSLGLVHAEAASVCLEERGHGLDCTITLKSSTEGVQKFRLLRLKVTQRMKNAYNDMQYATQKGAEGIAFLIIQFVDPVKVIRQSRKGTGFDYWLGSRDHNKLVFQDAGRLEVSGILIEKGTNKVDYRITKKRKQTNQSDASGLNAYHIVVEFQTPKASLDVKWLAPKR